MIVICSGCEDKMGEKEPFEDKRVSHGICRKCRVAIYGQEFAEAEQEPHLLNEAPSKEKD